MPANCLKRYTLPDKARPWRHVLWDGLWIYFNKSSSCLSYKAVFQRISALYLPKNNDKIDL